MAYFDRITLFVPKSMQNIAQQISKAFDPDIGGEFAFQLHFGGEVIYSTCCVPEFADALDYFQQNPEMLYNSTVRDYSVRWPDLTPPSLEDVTAFCTAVRIQRGEWAAPIIGDTSDV